MTDEEMIRKLTEKNIRLEEQQACVGDTLAKYREMYYEQNEALNNAESRCTEFARKLKAIEDEVNSYQFDSATNLQNKIKTILMSNELQEAKH